MRVIPVLFCVITITCAVATFLRGGVLFAAPPEEKLPELSKPQLHREKTKLEKAVNQAAAMLLQGKLPPTEDGVRFALWLYGEKGDVAYLDVATKMARELVKMDREVLKKDPIMSGAALYWVAQAGGPTMEEAKFCEAELIQPTGVPRSKLPPEMLLLWYSSLAATHEREFLPLLSPAHGGESFERNPTIAEMSTLLWIAIEIKQFDGGNEVVGPEEKARWDTFWDAKKRQFRDAATAPAMVHRDNTRAALAVWEAGLISGDAELRNRAQQALESHLEAALADSNAAAIAGLAAARMSHHPVQLAIIGNPADSTVTALRQAAYFLFEPNKIILNLDPKADSTRMAELMYSPDAAPAMFVCVETLCSPPIKNPAELEKQVAEIKKLAAEVQQ